MNNSSAQTTYSYTSDGDITTGSITIDLSNIGASQTVTLTPSSLDSITITDSYFTWKTPSPFEDSFPEWDDFQKMCKEYPGLEQAYEKLKTFYVLCKDEWETKKKEQK